MKLQLAKKIFILLLICYSPNSFADDYVDFIYVECDKIANRFLVEERSIRWVGNYDKLEQKSPKYFLPNYNKPSYGECDISSKKITWKSRGFYIYIYVDGKEWVRRVNVSDIINITMNQYKENLELFIRVKKTSMSNGVDGVPIDGDRIYKELGSMYYSEKLK